MKELDMVNHLIINENEIQNKIYTIRGVQVMLDSDLAEIFKVETKRINEAVKNNPNKFPERYSWKLSNEDWDLFKVENFDFRKIEIGRGKYRKYNPRVFTEQGIYMLTTIIKSDVATEASRSEYKNNVYL